MMESAGRQKNARRWAGVAGGVIAFALLPLFMGEGTLSLVNEMLILGVAACGLNLMMGYAGKVSF